MRSPARKGLRCACKELSIAPQCAWKSFLVHSSQQQCLETALLQAKVVRAPHNNERTTRYAALLLPDGTVMACLRRCDLLVQ